MQPDPGRAYGGRLLPHHAEKLAASAVSAEVAADRGYVSADTKAQLERCGFSVAQRRPPALVIPIYGVTGEIVGHQARPDNPRNLSGRPVKYETAAGGRAVLDVPRRVQPMLGDPAVPLVVTEGPIKADAAASVGLACIALLGVWSFRGRNDDNGLVALADWDYVALNGRRVVLAFDSDVMLKASVYAALRRLSAVVEHRGAEVFYAYLPGGEHGKKVGLDDWLAAAHDTDDLWQLCSAELRTPLAVPAERLTVDDYADVADESGSELLDEVAAIVARYVAMPSEHHLHAVALWVLHTWCAEAADSTPRLAVVGPEKGIGKSRLLEVLDLVCRAPLMVLNTTPAALYRSLARQPRTILLDEADAVFGPRAGNHEDLRAMLNAGHRRGATIPRCVGDATSMEVTEFPCYAPAAIAGIGDLPDTITSRSVVVRMRRRLPDEKVASLRQRTAESEAAPLVRRLRAWTDRNSDLLARIVPPMPPGVVDRPADVWEPLVAIGDAAGGPWSERARAAALAVIANGAEDGESLGVRLLRDLRNVFAGRAAMHTTDILTSLTGIEDAPWGDLRGKPLDARGLARRLRPYEVKPRDVKLDGANLKGYSVNDLADAWERYLPISDTQKCATSATSDIRYPNATEKECPTSPVASVAQVAHIPGAERQAADVTATEGLRRRQVAL